MSHLKIYIDVRALSESGRGEWEEKEKGKGEGKGEAQQIKLLSLYMDAVERLNEDIKNGVRHRNSGFDLFLPFDVHIATNVNKHTKRQLTIDHYVSCAVYDNDGNPQPYYLYPRSSISKTPLRMANSVGIIDSGYRGHLMAKVDVLLDDDVMCEMGETSETTTTPVRTFSIGERLFQVCSHNLLPFQSVEIVNSLDETTRGDGGFGSTGR